MTLQEEFNKLKEATAARAPKAALEIMHRATEDLRNSGIMEGTVKVGDPAPGFSLNNAYGAPVRLEDLVSEGPAVVTFFRGKW